MRIYCCHPISGAPVKQVFGYYDEVVKTLEDMGYIVLSPMTGKGQLRTELEFCAVGYEGCPAASNHAIFQRDMWMVRQADLVYANLLNTTRVSIGTMMELAWASLLGKHVIVAMEKDSYHRHAFVLEAASIVFEDHDSALDYLRQMAPRRKCSC